MSSQESHAEVTPEDGGAEPVRVSVLMPTWQGMEFLPRVCAALRAQRTTFRWDFRIIDSGSTDGTWEFLIEEAESFPVPLQMERIHGVEFDHGDTRNLLAARSRGEIMVFLTQDAIPGSEDWLERFVGNFDNEEVGAAYCRNVPRPDANPLTKIFSAGDPGYAEGRREVRLPAAEEYAAMGPHERRLLYNFNDVASGFRRSLWRRHPFPRTPFGEDILMARAFLEAGYCVVYDDAAVVEHSHDYDARETRARASIDATFNAEWLDRICVASAKDAATLTRRLAGEDALAIEGLGLSSMETAELKKEGLALRRAAFEGLYEGGLTKRRRHTTKMRDEATLKLLYVVHGFPPDTWAGTEIYTYNIASEMQRRGHEVTILTRSGPEADEPEFTLRREEFQGLRVIRMTHRLAFGDLRESFLRTGPEIAFREVLAEVEPDLVHFQHLIHMSAGLVDIARRRGLATVVTCHDYWALCARVQMIRPDGAICPSNMGSGCYLCIKERGLDRVEQAAKLDGTVRAGKIVGRMAELLNKIGVGPQGMQSRAQDFRHLQERAEVVPAAYAKADLRISPSRFLRDKYLESGAFDPHTFLFSDNGMRTDHVEALSKTADPEGRIRFGFVGSLVWYKGGEVLIQAMKRIAMGPLKNRIHLHVYGGFDPENDEHHRDLAALAQGAPVTFHGRFDNSRLSEVYADIDVLVVPSVWYENSPITIHEAYLTRTPVLASDIGGMAEFVRDGIDGLTFRVGSADDLAAKMARFIEEPELLKSIDVSDWMPIKTLAQNGEEMEARYLALTTIVREVGAGADGHEREILMDAPGSAASGRLGACEVQGAADLLLRPGASATWSLPAARAGVNPTAALEVELAFLEGETSVQLGGTVFLDGEEIGRMSPAATQGPAETRSHTFRIQLPASKGSLSLKPDGFGEDPLYLRVRRVRLYSAPATPVEKGADGADALLERQA
ncbi:D-inositol-3-phosphate glycosyltransferase [Planctomycetes bacterium Poly30]|uniref:D-inositol-3-phosphate glycosyltransferase n=1 Tax=Saltatorellus ferox TaxID=2528018 RepID=A0A518ES47_9BACT|nr:D-inositol-3-phosphate glycosyltransferase [Planctomycetes bacterium Poly30]